MKEGFGGVLEIGAPEILCPHDAIEPHEYADHADNHDERTLHSDGQDKGGNQGNNAEDKMRPVFGIIEPPIQAHLREQTFFGSRTDNADHTEYAHHDEYEAADKKKLLGIHKVCS